MPNSCAKRPDQLFLRLVFAGTPEFAERALGALHQAGHTVALVLTQPDRPVGRGHRLSQSPVKRYALDHQFALYQPDTLKPAEVAERIAAVQPDALVVAAYGLILPDRILRIAHHGALNIHASLLPRWRGAAPIQRALLAGDQETGISIMRMDTGLDTGPVLATERVPITSEDDAGSVHDRLAALGGQLMISVLAELAAGRGCAKPQPSFGETYARKIEKAETELDWARPAIELERAVRAYRPAPGAVALLSGEPLKLWRSGIVEASGVPGTILRASDTGLVVACGEQALEIRELQRPGGRRMSAAQFLHGHPIAPGARFG